MKRKKSITLFIEKDYIRFDPDPALDELARKLTGNKKIKSPKKYK